MKRFPKSLLAPPPLPPKRRRDESQHSPGQHAGKDHRQDDTPESRYTNLH